MLQWDKFTYSTGHVSLSLTDLLCLNHSFSSKKVSTNT